MGKNKESSKLKKKYLKMLLSHELNTQPKNLSYDACKPNLDVVNQNKMGPAVFKKMADNVIENICIPKFV